MNIKYTNFIIVDEHSPDVQKLIHQLVEFISTQEYGSIKFIKSANNIDVETTNRVRHDLTE